MTQLGLLDYRPAPSPEKVRDECRREARSRVGGQAQLRVLEAVLASGERGATALEIERDLPMKGSTVRPRLLELEAAGRLRRTTERRDGAQVWRKA